MFYKYNCLLKRLTERSQLGDWGNDPIMFGAYKALWSVSIAFVKADYNNSAESH
jgi:hypothetical protein